MIRYLDIFIDPNPNVPDGCGQRFKAESEPRAVSRVRFDGRECEVAAWSSSGAVGAAQAALVEDSGSGTAMLIFGGEWGVRLTPKGGGEPFGEPYLLIDADAILG